MEINPEDELQMMKALEMLAANVSSYFAQLTQKGVPPEVAGVLALELQKALLVGATKG